MEGLTDRVRAALSAERDRQGITSAQLARACGVSGAWIRKALAYPAGERPGMTLATVSRIAAALGVEVDVVIR